MCNILAKPTMKSTHTSLSPNVSTPAPEVEGSGDVDKDFEFVEEKPTEEKKEETGWLTGLFGDDPNTHIAVNIFSKICCIS